MKTGASLKNRQGGAVAVMVGISIVLLVGFLAMVIDLGHLYVAKTGLQNAADAAALAGVKQLDGTAARICSAGSASSCDPDSAVYKAIYAAGRNAFFGNSADSVVNIDPSNISFSSSQSGPWATVSEAWSSPAGKLFIKVDTASGNLTTWFAPIWNILNMSTFGTAVAGPIMQNVAPLAVCALNGDSTTEYGFRRGVNYNIIEVNELYVGVGGFPAVPLFLNPVDIPPAACDPSNGSNNFMNTFVCQGVSALGQVGKGSLVYVNTGATAAQNRSLNSRFNDFTGSQCNMQTAPPDTNVKEYSCTKTGGGPNPLKCANSAPGTGLPQDWMQPTVTPPSDPLNKIPTQPSMSPISGVVPDPNTFANYGVLWSHAWESEATPQFGLADWPALYGGSAVPSSGVDGYPASGVPYTQTSGSNYFQAPTGPGAAYATPNRRVVNMVLVDCPENQHVDCGGMPGNAVPTLGIASFFMTGQAGLPDRLDVEFGGLVPAAALERQYRLFR